MSTPQFKTFDALCLYAATRAAKSAKRNDPIAWAYWRSTADWADGCTYPTKQSGFRADEVAQGRLQEHLLLRDANMKEGLFVEAAYEHSRVKWCAAILRAHGSRVKVSLDWMREVK